MGSKPKVKQVEAPKTYVAAEAPSPEQTAEAPVAAESAQTADERRNKRKGTSALKIDLNIGGGASDGNGVNIPY